MNSKVKILGKDCIHKFEECSCAKKRPVAFLNFIRSPASWREKFIDKCMGN